MLPTRLMESVQPQEEKKKELTIGMVAEMIDTTFVNGCMQLAQGYVDVLKLMIVATKSAYEMGVPLATLVDQVNLVDPNAAGRDLMVEEMKLRNTWMQVVYLVLNDAVHTTTDEQVQSCVDQEIVDQYASALPRLKALRQSGDDFGLEGFLLPDDVLQNAIMSQSLRVMWLTQVVLEEEERCNTEFARQDAPLKPTIPGADMPTNTK